MCQKRVTDLSPDVKERIEEIVREIGQAYGDGAKIDYEREELVVYGEAGYVAIPITLKQMQSIIELIKFDGAEIQDK